MQLTTNFLLDEFKCKDGSAVPTHLLPNVILLAKHLQKIRDRIGRPIHINSGYRSISYNRQIGGVQNSQHLLGKAADIYVSGMSPKVLSNIIINMINEGVIINGGLGIYTSFVHYDVRNVPTRWQLL